jgi:hypothetical protein
MSKVHDLGGKPAGDVDLSPHPKTEFDRQANALLRLLMHPDTNIIYVDELRRAIEDVGEETYFELSYYERWIHAAHVLLVEHGLLTEEEIEQRMAKIREELKLSGHA